MNMYLRHRHQSIIDNDNDNDKDSCMTSSVVSRCRSDSDRSNDSHHSASTAPTEYDYCSSTAGYVTHHKVEVIPDDDSDLDHQSENETLDMVDNDIVGSQTSVHTYASTVPSIHDLEDDVPHFRIPQFRPRAYYSDDIPTTPSDFAELFPSATRMAIVHDDSTPDGNMNIKVNVMVKTDRGRLQTMTLFHLRMYNLRSREFSFRRYFRDSGREVCHSSRKYRPNTSDRRPNLQRSLSSVLSSLRVRSESKINTPNTSSSKHDLEHLNSAGQREDQARPPSTGRASKVSARIPTNAIGLEFSNYSQVEVVRRGSGSGKRYEFRYWGQSYRWKRTIQKDDQEERASFHLHDTNSDVPIAHISPEPLNEYERYEEISKCGWVPPCSMRFNDERLHELSSDVAEVVVAAGLLALVDDCIKREAASKHVRRSSFTKLSKASTWSRFDSGDSSGPKRLWNEIRSRPATSHGTTSSCATPPCFREETRRHT